MKAIEALNKLQTVVNAPKDRATSRYTYRNLDDICKAIKKPLEETGAVIVLTDEPVVIGNRVYIKATAGIYTADDANGVFATAYAREEEASKMMSAAQITGAASSYARKYALGGLLLLDDNKDADVREEEAERLNTRKHPANENVASYEHIGNVVQRQRENISGSPMTSEQAAKLEATAKRKGVRVEDILAFLKVKNMGDVTIGMWSTAMNLLRARADV